MFDLSGKVALVTGGGQNIGAGIAKLLARQGAAVAVNDLHADRAERTAEQIVATGATAVAVPFDVTTPDAVAAGVAVARQTLGPVDILINNAGVPEGMAVARFREMAPAAWAQFVELNLYGVLHCTKAVIDEMCTRSWGRVITVSSVAGQAGLAFGVSLYAAGKGGAIAFMRHLALEVARSGVTVNTVSLGLMNTVGDSDLTTRLAATIPCGRLGTPEDAGAAIVFLASEEAAWVTGQTIGVNGGTLTS